MRRLALVVVLFSWVGPLGAESYAPPDPRFAVEATLDRFHIAAAVADEKEYFDLIAPVGVFLGTDATERWDRESFRAFAKPYFDQGKGWAFSPRDRHVALSAGGDVAWFDELLDSASYGECRGTGVLEKIGGEWKIQQYHLTIPIPNALAKEVVERIRVGDTAADPAK